MRAFLIFVCAVFALTSNAVVHAGAKEKVRPNVLWIIAEDMGPELGCMGTPEANTPVLDGLARRGMLFTNAFTVTPVCSTSRSSFMTGMYAMAINAHNHRSHRGSDNPLPEGVRVLSDWFRSAGYSTANIRRLPKDNPGTKWFGGTGKTDWNFTYPKGKKPFDTSDWSQLKENQPFFAQINFSESHRGGAWNSAHKVIDKIADPKKVEIPPYYPDHPVTRGVWAQYLNAISAVDKKVEGLMGLLKKEGLDKNTIVVFLGDHGRAMPRGKQWPYDSGLHIPLIVYWPEGNPDLPPPTGYTRGKKCDELVASIDLSATTLAMAGIEKPEKMQGHVFLGPQKETPREYLFAGRDRGDETVLHIRTVRDKQYRYLVNKYPERPFFQINRYKEARYPIISLMRDLHEQGSLTGPPAALMADSRPAEELYDITADPWEVNNLAADPKYAEVKARLKKELIAWGDRINDTGRIPESPEIIAANEKAMQRHYDKELRSRPKDWYKTDGSLGPYKLEKD